MFRIFTFSLSFIFLFAAYTSTHAQHSCSAAEYRKWQLENDPAFIKWVNELESRANSTEKSGMCPSTCTPIVIPVAVHFNMSMAASDRVDLDCSNPSCLMTTVNQQIQELNAAFGAQSSTTNSAGEFENYAALTAACPAAYPASNAPVENQGSCIQFCLATMNHPSGTSLVDGQPAITVGLHEWPSAGAQWQGYLNLFVSDSQPPLGVAPTPGAANGDGAHIHPSAFGGLGQSCTSGGALNTFSEYNRGGTCIHEVGHYFGLFHTFDGGNCTAGTDGDVDISGPCDVNDTPVQQNSSGGVINVTNCASAPQDCAGNYHAFYSYMDYTDDVSMAMFTADQSLAMNWNANQMPFKSNTTVCDANITDYSGLTINCNATVPVELSSFTGEALAEGNLLDWKTETEIQNEGFYVERSIDGKDFAPLDFVDGKGDSPVAVQYSYMDTRIAANTSYYYRLKQMDFDGKYSYSETIFITNKQQSVDVQIHPSLVRGESINIQVEGVNNTDNLSYKIFNLVGQLVLSGNISETNTNVSLDQINGGVYLIRLDSGNSTIHSQRLVKLN